MLAKLNNIKEKLIAIFSSIIPENTLRENPWLLIPIIVGVLLLVWLGLYVAIVIIGKVFGTISGGFWKMAAAFVVVVFAYAVVHLLAESLAQIIVFILCLVATYLALKGSYTWDTLIIQSLLYGGIVGIISLPFHTFLKTKD